MGCLKISPTMDEFTTVKSSYPRVSHTAAFGPVAITATSGSSAIVNVTKQLVFNEMMGVWLESYGCSSNYAHSIHIYSWSAGTNSLTIRFCGDIDTYTPLVIGMLWR